MSRGLHVQTRAFLAEQREPPQLADEVAAAIEASDSPSPDKVLQEVLHDALLVPIASKNYLELAEQFRLERERRNDEVHSDVEWSNTCIAFFDNHHFLTHYTQLEYDGRRAGNLVRLHKLLRKQVVVGLLLRRLEEQRYLMLPTFVLLTVNLLTIVLSIYSMRIGRSRLRQILGGDVAVHDDNLLMSATTRRDRWTSTGRA